MKVCCFSFSDFSGGAEKRIFIDSICSVMVLLVYVGRCWLCSVFASDFKVQKERD